VVEVSAIVDQRQPAPQKFMFVCLVFRRKRKKFLTWLSQILESLVIEGYDEKTS
jgi:hypothetical protein